LLSIGRFSWAKNFDNIPEICRRIIQFVGLKNIKWFIIGYGDDKTILQNIVKAGVEKNVILLGKKNNPYPYIKACDIYVQPSRYEGKCVAVREAQILCKPVAITNYSTSSSQIKNGVDGIITPLDNEGCAKALSEFIVDEKFRAQISGYLSCHDYGNESEISKIYDLLN
jgi:glycosyltransferase involved in cell wall biosynthesis